MDSNAIPSILKSLDASQSKQSSYQYLSSLKRVVKSKSQFTSVLNSGGIRILLGCLNQKHANIIDAALSVLANCCTERSCTKEVIRYAGMPKLIDILKNWPQDSIICRACRVIANMAKFESYASEFYKCEVVPMIVNILNKSTLKNELPDKSKNKISLGTQDMAVRVLRTLWNTYSIRQKMIEDGVVKAVSLVLIRNAEKWASSSISESNKNQIGKLLENILKCLLLFSKWGTAECAKQLLADGNGFKTLVTLIEINPYSAVKCLTNLSHVATSRSDIANSEAVNCIIAKLKDHMERKPHDRFPNDIIGAFCLFCKHPLNCSEVKKAGGLQLILEVLKHCKSRRQEYQIVNALSGFHFDEQSQELLMSSGVVNIVINCLERNLKSKIALNEPHNFIKRKKRSKITLNLKNVDNNKYSKRIRESSPSIESPSPPALIYLNDPWNMIMNCGRMTPPDSDSSPFSSPGCTPPRKNDFEIEDDDSVNYSPVCSDVELDSQENDIINKDCNSLQTISNLESDQESDEEYSDEKTHFECSDFQEKAIIMMLIVLSRVSHMKPNSPDLSLGSKETLITLLKYLRESRHPNGRITTLLTRIVSNPDNLTQLIISESIILIHNLTDLQHSSDCSVCYRMESAGQLLLKNITNMAESDPGKGQLFNIMQKKNFEHKRKCILSVPFIITLKPMLLKFMDTWSGLSILLKLFLENNLRLQTCIALNKLACSIKINNPVSASNPRKTSNLSDQYVVNTNCENIITIKLDDDSTVETDRDFLIERADYFKVMLTGSFLESNQEVIRLKNVSNPALQCLLNLLKYDYEKLEPQLLNINLLTILEVIVLSDIYLLEKLTVWLTRCVELYSLRADTASDIYNWSIASGTNYLRVETVAFILTAKVNDSERYQVFENIVDGGFLAEIKEDMQRLISRYMKIR